MVKAEVEQAEQAAVEPANKKQSMAQAEQVSEMEEQETPAFNASAFVEALLQRVAAIMPKTNEEADKFKDSGKVGEVKAALSNTIDDAQDQSVGPLEEATQERPDESGIESKKVEPLTGAPIGSKPQDIHAEDAMPKPVSEASIEQPLEQNSKELDQLFEEQGITDEQLSKSNEPTFLSALESKQAAQQDSEAKKTQLRTEEQETLANSQQSAKGQGKDQMNAMFLDRTAILTNVEGKKENAGENYTAEEKKVADKINAIYERTKSSVEGRLSRLDARVQQVFDAGAAQARQRFEDFVARKMAAYKEERYGGVWGKGTLAVDWLKEKLLKIPMEVNAFYAQGRNLYISDMRRVIEQIAAIVAEELNAAKQEVQAGRQEVADYLESLPKDLRKVGEKAAQDINRKFSALDSQIDTKQSELIDSLAQKYKENVEQIDARIEEMKAANRGWLDKAFDAVVGVGETILEVKNALAGILSAAMDAIKAIILDPIGFLNNLIEGVGMGLNNFMSNISSHLSSGFVEWLTGAMSGIGIKLPENIFSLEGIFSLVTQALGLTYDYIREKAVKLLGERTVVVIEEGFEVFKIIQTDGIAGAWEYLKDKFNDLKDTIIGAITEMLISQVIEAGIKWIIGLMSPVGAFIKAAMMIVDVAEFFIEQGAKIMELVSGFINSVNAIAAGSLGQVASYIEEALSRSVPILIDFLASLLGLGGIADKVQKIFESIRTCIDAVIDGFIERVQPWFKDERTISLGVNAWEAFK